jgi:hypothetical protein
MAAQCQASHSAHGHSAVGRGGLLSLVLLAWANCQSGPAGLQPTAPGAGERALPSGRLAGRAADGGAWRSAQRGSVRAGAKVVQSGWATARPLPWAGPSAQCRF